jgi:hypothetical protein
MEDAYVVGIRIVLENGVSGGLLAVGRDLATFDRALATTTGNLQALRELGAGLAAPAAVGQPVRQQARPQVGVREPAPERFDRPERADVAMLEAPGGISPLRVTAPAVVESSKAPPPLPPQVLDDVLPVWGSVRATPPQEVPAPRAPVTASGAVPVVTSLPERVAPAAEPARSRAMMRYADFAPAPPPGAVAVNDTPGAAAQGTAVTAFEREAAQVSGRADGMVAIHQHPARPGGGEPLRPPLPLTGGEAAPRFEAPPRLAPPPAASPPPPAAAAPVASPASTGPVQGDVYLDGARVGRWLSDHLAREANRPQTGVTGFDSRLGLAWPGSMHGT